MVEKWQLIGGFLIRLGFANERSAAFVRYTIGDRYVDAKPGVEPDYSLTIEDGYGESYDEATPVAYRKNEHGDIEVERADFRLESAADLKDARLRFYDYFGLRTGLLNWYSRILARRNWGLVIHSSCIVQDGQAYLFSGYSGAGKSTIASMSRPRPIMADETSLVEIRQDGRVLIHDSPFRNDFKEPYPAGPVPLKGIYLIKQSSNIKQHGMSKSEAMFSLFDKVVFWSFEQSESTEVVRLCRALVDRIPVYELEFQKNDRFWEAIS
ncbi:hypothetical protein [Cohnella thailandensis]|uniref:Aldolase n=1 Tax=Cohnella thailandensis TaxID=557557 RepID=A0A841SV16_9BACL|nr:hypothetical protein [Cohnella thailandensis]MBB6635102.1 hypothetical protein [Cohnella thailandensis]MBP1974433.1 hypothetical protein [Cohnella thailandensis]